METVLTTEMNAPTLQVPTTKGTAMTAVHDYDCAQTDRVAERASRNAPRGFAHKLQAAAILAAGVVLFFAVVLGFVL